MVPAVEVRSNMVPFLMENGEVECAGGLERREEGETEEGVEGVEVLERR